MSLDLHANIDRKEVLNGLEDNMAQMEATIYGAMFLMNEAFDKETPTAYALWHTFEQLKQRIAEVRILELRGTG